MESLQVCIRLQYLQFCKHEFIADIIAGYLQYRLSCDSLELYDIMCFYTPLDLELL